MEELRELNKKIKVHQTWEIIIYSDKNLIEQAEGEVKKGAQIDCIENLISLVLCYPPTTNRAL